MNISAIISEYNPFHNGHLYHINKTKDLCNTNCVIVLMSGNFAQRGIPCVIDKWNRAEMALLNGADLVLELPSVFALSSAEFFAKGSVSLLNSLNCVTHLSFGSECGDIDLIQKIAMILSHEPKEYKGTLKNLMDSGLPFAKARFLALKEYIENTENIPNLSSFLSSSNNILAIEYCKSLIQLNSNIKPITVQRLGGEYNENSLNEIFSSATSLRNLLKENIDFDILKDHMPTTAFHILKNLKDTNYNFVFDEDMFSLLKYKLTCCENNLNLIPDASEGLDNKIIKEVINSDSLKELILNSKSKRYTYTRINRILCQYFIGLETFDLINLRTATPSYCRVLGFTENGSKILKLIKNNSNIDIITKIPKTRNDMLNADIKSTKAYSILCKNIKPNNDFLKSPIIIKNT